MTDRTGRDRSAGTQALLESVARALGAKRALLLPPGIDPPEPRRIGWLRREDTQHLTVDVPGERPPRRLVFELTRPPNLEDRLLARAFVRIFEPAGGDGLADRRRPERDAVALLRAAARKPDERPEMILRVLADLFGSRAAGLAIAGDETRFHTHGPGRPVLRNAARRALEGPDGSVEMIGRSFTVRRLVHHGEVVGGLAIEGARESAELRGAGAVLAAILAEPRSSADARDAEEAHPDLGTGLSILPIPALAVDAEGRLLGASPEAERLFGLTDFDLGMHVASRLRVLGVEDVLAGGDLPGEVVVGERWLEPTVALLPSGGRLFVLLDHSREEGLEKTREELVAAMAHELRTPIAGVKALLEVLKVAGARQDPERLDGMVGEGIREVGRLERLVEDLLLATRAATGGILARPDVIELRPVVDNVVKHVRERYPDRALEVRGEGRATADPALVRHALWHLVDNAAKFGEAGTRVDVEIREGGRGSEIEVTDDGPGIFSGDLEDLFLPFKRLDRNTAAQHGGSGVGLYLVRAICEAQSGRVDVRSRLGKGSTFTVTLPPPSNDT